MRPKLDQLERALDKPTDAVRLFLLYGPDESGSRALAGRLGAAMGAEAERVNLTGAMLKSDPARLADEAASISLFGGARHIRIDGAGDEALDAIAALLDAPTAGNPAVAIAGSLRKDAKLVKLAGDAVNAMAFASYLPEGAAADTMALEAGRAAGLEMTTDVARRLAQAAGNDRQLLGHEIEKLSLYLDAAPDRRREVGHEALDALIADASEGSLAHLVDAVLDGRPDATQAETARLAADGVSGVTVLLALERRLVMLAQLRAEVEAGNAIGRVMESSARGLFWRDKDAVTRQLRRWQSGGLAHAIGRIIAAKRMVMRGSGPGPLAADAELLAIARHAARLRR